MFTEQEWRWGNIQVGIYIYIGVEEQTFLQEFQIWQHKKGNSFAKTH